MSISFEPIAKHYPQGLRRVASVDIHQVGDLLVCGDCATGEVVAWKYFLTDIEAFCDYCGRDLTSPRMFDTSH